MSLAIPHQEKRSPQYPAPSPFFRNTVASAYRNPNNNRNEPEREGGIHVGVSPTIRVATAEDAERLSELAARTFRETFAPDNTAEDMAAYLAATFTLERQRSELEETSRSPSGASPRCPADQHRHCVRCFPMQSGDHLADRQSELQRLP